MNDVLVVGAGPGGVNAAARLVEEGKNVVDIAFFPEDPFDLDELAKKNLRNALSPDDVARVVLRAVNARRPKERYYAPFSVKIQHTLLDLLPARLRDAILLRVYKLEKL